MTPPDFEDRKRARQKLPSLMAENGNACTTCAYLSPTPGFLAPFYYCQCLCPFGQRCSNTNDGRLSKWWCLHTMNICTFCAWLNPAQACGSVLVRNTCTTCILRRLHRSKYEQRIRRMDYWWSLKERALKTYTVFFTLHAYLRSAHACAWIILSNIQRWTCLWSRAVLHRWSTIDGARQQFDGTLQMVPHLRSIGCPFPRT